VEGEEVKEGRKGKKREERGEEEIEFSYVFFRN